jgi:hypothetical protein
MEIKKGDIIRSYDFHFNTDCYNVGIVTDVDDKWIYFTSGKKVWMGEEIEDFDPYMRTAPIGFMMLDEEFERILILA